MSERDTGAVLQPISRSNIVDARADFRQLYCAVNEDHGNDLPDYRDCDDALHKLADEQTAGALTVEFGFSNDLQVYVIPGIFGECLIGQVSPFSFAIEHMKSHDVEINVVPGIHGRASSPFNAKVIHEFFDELEKPDGLKVLVVAYSKGTTDMLYYLGSNEYAGSHGKIDALISVAGVVNGTPLADDTSELVKKLAKHFPYDECPTQDESGIDDLTREQQFLRLSGREIPDHIKLYSVVTYTTEDKVSSILMDSYNRLSLVDPRNDSQVIYYDSVLPGAHLLGYANADHWAVALPFARQESISGFVNRSVARGADKNEYPREILFESILRYVDKDLGRVGAAIDGQAHSMPGAD